jgi:hypothetical protein
LLLVLPDLPLGILGPLYRDALLWRPLMDALAVRISLISLIGFVFFVDISQSLRRLPPSCGTLFSLSGQAALFGIALVYVLRGELPPLALYGIGGTFVLSFVGIVAVVQSYTPTRRFTARGLLYPVLSLLMGGLGVGLILSPDTATREVIDLHYGPVVLVGLLGLLAWGCGQLRQNHLSPDKMVRRLMGIVIYPALSVRLLVTGTPVSLLGVFLTINVAGTAVFLAFVQAEIERVESSRYEASKVPLQVMGTPHD